MQTPAHAALGDLLSYAGTEPLVPGTLVRVPLGKRDVTGIVWDDDPQAAPLPDAELKPVRAVLGALPPLDDAWRALVGFAAGYYQRGVGELALSVLPPELRQLDDAQIANRIAKLRWDPIPEGAITALRQCPDNLYNRYDQGGYLLWFVPERKVYLDGRQDPYPPPLILEQIRLENGGGAYEVFSRFHIRCAYLPTVSPTVPQLEQAGWTVTYRDADWVVFTH